MRLMPPEAFTEVFEPLKGKRVGLIQPLGNVGDEIIHWATTQLLDVFAIDWQVIEPTGVADVDEIVFGGGGNMGTLYRNNWELRGQILRLGRPVTVFPQSFTSAEDRPYARVYVREQASLAYCPGAILAPDLALGLDVDRPVAPTRELGVFIRKDRERVVRRPWFSRDPVRRCRDPKEYLRLAAGYRRVVTDRLHFAISALIAGRDVTLLPNSYHKNRSLYETWLAALGCKFAWSVDEAIGRIKRDSYLPGREEPGRDERRAA